MRERKGVEEMKGRRLCSSLCVLRDKWLRVYLLERGTETYRDLYLDVCCEIERETDTERKKRSKERSERG